MSTGHELKCWPGPFQAIMDGRKTHEFRRNDDRCFVVGDILTLEEWDPERKGGEYTGRHLLVAVTYISRGPDWGIPAGYDVMSIARLPPRGQR